MEATASQAAHATKLQTEIRERLTWKFNRETMRMAFMVDKDESTKARVRELKAEGRMDEAKALNRQAREKQETDTEQAMDDYLARRAELADTDLSTLDKDEMSAWIDAAKNHSV